MTSWAEEEVKTAALGDQRLNKRLIKILDHLGQHPQISIPAACGGWAETLGAYRFFDNEKSDVRKRFDAASSRHAGTHGGVSSGVAGAGYHRR